MFRYRGEYAVYTARDGRRFIVYDSRGHEPERKGAQMEIQLTVYFRRLDNEVLAFIAEFPQLQASGRSRDAARDAVLAALDHHLKVCRELGAEVGSGAIAERL